MTEDNKITGQSMVRVMSVGASPIEIAFQRNEPVSYYIRNAERMSNKAIRFDEEQHEITMMGAKVSMDTIVEEFGVTLTIAPNFVNGDDDS